MATACARATVIIATGAEYRQLALENASRFLGSRHLLCGNRHRGAALRERQKSLSSGAAIPQDRLPYSLPAPASRVHLLVRSKGLADSMSQYLIRRIEDTPNITLRVRTEITALEGEEQLARVTWRTGPTDNLRRMISVTCFS